MNIKESFNLIEKKYLNEIFHISNKPYIEDSFKMAYLILFFHNSKDDIDGKNLLKGDLFISLLNRYLLPLDRVLLKKITDRINLCYTKKINGEIHDYKEELLDLLKEVS